MKQLPKNTEALTGYAFKVNTLTNILETKYTCGTALLIAPFFLLTKFLINLFGFNNYYFGLKYIYMLVIAASFYAALGLTLLQKAIFRNHGNLNISLLVPLLFFVGTNMFWYVSDAPAYSHLYSFFLASALIYFTPYFYNNTSVKNVAIISVIATLAILCRPTNALFLIYFIGYNLSTKNIGSRITHVISNYKLIIFSAVICIFIAAPQLLYWKQISGHYFINSYGNEGFTNLLQPQILILLFSTNNGWLLYSPLLILAFVGLFLMLKNKQNNSWAIIVMLVLAIYLFASWWIVTYGCAYGCRVFVEYYPFLILPFTYFINAIIRQKNKIKIIVLSTFIIACVIINLDMIYYYDGCFYGGAWDFESYLQLLEN